LPSVGAQECQEAQRLEFLWRNVNTPSLRGDNFLSLSAMLREALAAALPFAALQAWLAEHERSV
jgi:hypothetical protein